MAVILMGRILEPTLFGFQLIAKVISFYIEPVFIFLCLNLGMLNSGHPRVRRAFADVLDELLELFLRALSFPSHLQVS